MRWAWEAAVVWAALVAALLPTRPVLAQGGASIVPARRTTPPTASPATTCADLVGLGGVGVRVWPTIKANAERRHQTQHFRLLQINWEVEEVLDGDWVGVWAHNPQPPHLRRPTATPRRHWRAPHPLYWDTPFATRGTLTTNLTQPRVQLSQLAQQQCVGPYVGYVRNGVCVAADCLRSHPSWLYEHRDTLGGRSLRSLVLPGTHNSGTFSLSDGDDVVSAWVICQDEDIISQLLYGNRYLDLRVSYYPDTAELLWVNHDLVRWRPLTEVLDHVKGFLAISHDPVILDIHRTPVGFQMPDALPLLLSLMNSTLGEHFLHNRYGPQITLEQVWRLGKRVIFTFNDPDVSDEHEWVWPPIYQAWANAQKLDNLRQYLDTQMNRRAASPRLWAAMAHLTPTLWDLLLRSHIGLRGMTNRVSFSITMWLRQRWGHKANIFASDFFRSNDVINVAIRTNLALTLCRPTSDRSRKSSYTLRRSAGQASVQQALPASSQLSYLASVYRDYSINSSSSSTVSPSKTRDYDIEVIMDRVSSTTSPTHSASQVPMNFTLDNSILKKSDRLVNETDSDSLISTLMPYEVPEDITVDGEEASGFSAIPDVPKWILKSTASSPEFQTGEYGSIDTQTKPTREDSLILAATQAKKTGSQTHTSPLSLSHGYSSDIFDTTGSQTQSTQLFDGTYTHVNATDVRFTNFSPAQSTMNLEISLKSNQTIDDETDNLTVDTLAPFSIIMPAKQAHATSHSMPSVRTDSTVVPTTQAAQTSSLKSTQATIRRSSLQKFTANQNQPSEESGISGRET